MKSGLVSIIMPAYNGQKYIQQAIDSIIAQTYSKWELIVVDDGSTDNTAEIVTAFSDPRIRYIYQQNCGQATALNQGLALAQGDYVTTLDADDWLTPDSLSERAHFLEQHPELGVVYGDGYYCDINGKPLLRFSENRINNVSGDVYDTLITSPFFGTGANVLVRRQIFEQYQIRYDESIVWCQDWDIYIRIAEKATFGVVDTIILWYRLHEANMTMSMPEGRRLDSLIRTKFKVLASPRFEKVSVGPKYKFFYPFLIHELQGQIQKQTDVIENPHFQALPSDLQSTLLRLVASTYLLEKRHPEFAKDLLSRAWSLTPFDLKVVSLVALANLNLNLTKQFLKHRRDVSTQKNKKLSPLEMAKGE